jgi:DNA-binding NarL/FixJ family response regulator
VKRTRILVADSATIFRTGVATLLARERDFDVVEASSTQEAVRSLDRRTPDIALIGFDLPPLGGIQAVARLARRCDACLIVWSSKPSQEAVVSAIRAGASGYLRKEIRPHRLVRTLRGIPRGEAPLSPDLTMMLLEALRSYDAHEEARERATSLSAREREVLGLVA